MNERMGMIDKEQRGSEKRETKKWEGENISNSIVILKISVLLFICILTSHEITFLILTFILSWFKILIILIL